MTTPALTGAADVAYGYSFAPQVGDTLDGYTKTADGYVIKIVAVTGNRVVWESAPIAETETHLPTSVALEPEVHTWTVSARRGSEVLVTTAPQKFTITP